MAPLQLFKVWDKTRQNKTFVSIEDNDDLYTNLILKASVKLEIDGSYLVLEADGTVVDENEVLRQLHKETFMLLTKAEKWKSLEDDVNLSTCSTITVNSAAGYNENPNNEVPPSPLSNDLADEISFDDNRVSENTWETFQIPWDTLRKAVIEDCKKGNRCKNSINEVIHAVVNAIRDIKTYVPCKTFKIIAKKIIEQYPAMFKDIDEDGVIIGDGSHTIFCRLQDRNNYLNRPHKRKSLIQQLNVSPQNKKKILTAKAGCSNWQPDVIEDAPETLSEKQSFLNNSEFFEISQETLNSLNDTYPMQRLFLNNQESPPTLKDIKKEWPVLLKEEVILWHYKKLMDQDIDAIFDNITPKIYKIINFGTLKKYVSDIPSDCQEDYPIMCFDILGKFFNENNNVLINKLNKNSDVVQNIKTMAPCIALTETDVGVKEYSVYFEKEKIYCSDKFLQTFKIMFAIYYNFNVAYPKESALTMEFIQKYILKIHPDSGSKGKKSSKIKILSLINKLKEIPNSNI